MGTVYLPHPEQLHAERPWHNHFAGCRLCQAAPGYQDACDRAQRLHEDAVLAAQEAHFSTRRAGHQIQLQLEPPQTAWRIWSALQNHPALSAAAAAGPLAGIDVSKYQGGINFDAAAGSNWYVISKATEGVGYVDSTFARNWTETHRVGRIPGAYHFSRPDLGNSPESEADFFLSITGLETGTLLVHDAESNGGSEGWVRAWKDHIAARTSYLVGFYSYLSWIRSRGIGAGSSLNQSWLWLAWPDSNGTLPVPQPWSGVPMQQYGAGGVSGIAGAVDLDRFFGDLNQLRALTVGGGDDLPDETTLKQWFRDVLNEGTAFGELSWHATNSDHVALLQTVNNDLRAVHSELNAVVNLLVAGNTGDDNKWDSYVKRTVEPELKALKEAVAAIPAGPVLPGGGSVNLQPVLDAVAALRQTVANLTLSAQAPASPTPTPAPTPAPTPPISGGT